MAHLETALSYRRAGLCVLPAILGQKRPALAAWRPYQGRLPTEEEVRRWFERADALCLVAGRVSGNLEMLDFDLGGEAFQPWYTTVERADPGLLSRLVIEQSPSGGWHVAYRSVATICGNLKLAQRRQTVDGPEEVTIRGKAFKPRQDADGHWHVLLTLIETRGEGGLFLCAPSPGYELLQGDFTRLPVLSESEREALLEAAWSLNQHVPEPSSHATVPRAGPPASSDSGDSPGGRPGDDYNQRGDLRTVLKRHGWTLVKGGENEYWRRPGKTSGWSATLKDGVLFVFSQNAAPFEANQGYAPFSVYSMLEHHGDFAAAASALRRQGFGGEPEPATGVDLTELERRLRLGDMRQMAGLPLAEIPPAGSSDPQEPAAGPQEPPGPDNPGPIPEEMLRVPGFVSEIIDLCIETAPYPNQPMTFCGALALQAFLAGRKVRDSGDNRTNIYLLGLAHSSAGKDWVRKLNAKILHELGLSSCLGDRLASGEGIQDTLQVHPSMLFQSDEIDGILQSINKAKDARHEGLMTTLLSLYSSANSVFAMRPKAGKPDPGAIDQPNLVLFGTAIPNHYYEALSERMLTNGFFARQILVEAGKRKEGKEPGIIQVSDRVLTTAKWWADFRPGTGNLQNWHPVPAIVEHTPGAQELLVETRRQAEAEYAKAEDGGDAVGTTVWGRVSEHARKLALLYAVSENHQSPRIDAPAVEWASRFVIHQTRRMLFMASQHVADNPFHAECLRLLKKLREAPGQQLPHSVLLKRMKMPSRAFSDLVETLLQRGDVATLKIETAGRTGVAYRLEPE